MKRLDILRNESSIVSLLEEERNQIRESLLSYIDKTPAQSGGISFPQVRSPYTRWIVVAVVAGFIVASSGISYAASRSVPGDLLYPIKVGVNEKVMGYMAFSSKSKAEVQVDLAERRLEEAVKLQQGSDTDAQMWVDLRTNFNTHVATYESRVEKLKEVDEVAAETIDKKFKASLEEHSSVVAVLQIATSTSQIKSQKEKDDFKKVKVDLKANIDVLQ